VANLSEIEVLVLEWRAKVDILINALAKEKDPELLDLFKRLLQLNNSMVEVFWEIMIYMEKHGLPVPSPD